MFKPVKEEEEVNSKHGMRTRRSRAPVSPRLTDQSHLSLALAEAKILTDTTGTIFEIPVESVGASICIQENTSFLLVF